MLGFMLFGQLRLKWVVLVGDGHQVVSTEMPVDALVPKDLTYGVPTYEATVISA